MSHALLEAITCLTTTPESVKYAKECGIDPAFIEPHCCFLAVALANFFQGPAGNVFRLSPEGKPAVVIGARTAMREEPQDLVAWPLYGSRRDFWASFNLKADLLGIPQALRHRSSGAPLRLHRTPEDWLLSGFDGSCIVNQRWGGHWLNKLPGPFVCNDVRHASEVAAMLKPFGKDALVYFATPDTREAA